LDLTKLAPAGFFRRIPLSPHQMQQRLTPTEHVIVLCHLGVARLDREAWSLTIDGLVERSICLRFSDLTAYPKHTVSSFHQCAGSPLQPLEPTRRISNVRWSGARLSDLLRDCRPAPQAKYLWSYGADHGTFGDIEHAAYAKDLPLERVPSDVLIAYELNGAPLPAEHGFPARLVVPGFYGTNSVKWLNRMTLAGTRCAGGLHHALVQRPGLRCGRTLFRKNRAGLVGCAGIRDRVAGARRDAHARRARGDLGMGLGRRRDRPRRCQH
jgi:sulfane dehydrogenase subunit SoxC